MSEAANIDLVQKKFDDYPQHVKPKMNRLKALIFEVAEQDGLGPVTETLKWGQPSYLTPKGSTIRFDWSPKSPDTYTVYFICTTRLVETFKEIYPDVFIYDGKRALIFGLEDALPEPALKHCFSMAMNYRKLKNLPLLGA